MRKQPTTSQLSITRVGIVAMVGLAAGLGGCVNQGDYDSLVLENRNLTNRNQEMRAELDESNSALNALGDSRRDGDSTIGQLQNQIRDKDALLSEYEAAMQSLEDQLQGFGFGPLDAATDAALADLASSHSDLLSYDSDQGMLRFNSDLTFGSGSDAVSAGAKETLGALAGILKGGNASQYDLIIVGHTDSQRVGSITAQKHPTNMHLSCHRAISVRKELASLGIASGKIQAAGWGEQRPLVANTSTGNTPANRRVEIYLGRSVGGSSRGASPAGGSSGGTITGGVDIDRETPPDRQPGITK